MFRHHNQWCSFQLRDLHVEDKWLLPLLRIYHIVGSNSNHCCVTASLGARFMAKKSTTIEALPLSDLTVGLPTGSRGWPCLGRRDFRWTSSSPARCHWGRSLVGKQGVPPVKISLGPRKMFVVLIYSCRFACVHPFWTTTFGMVMTGATCIHVISMASKPPFIWSFEFVVWQDGTCLRNNVMKFAVNGKVTGQKFVGTWHILQSWTIIAYYDCNLYVQIHIFL